MSLITEVSGVVRVIFSSSISRGIEGERGGEMVRQAGGQGSSKVSAVLWWVWKWEQKFELYRR